MIYKNMVDNSNGPCHDNTLSLILYSAFWYLIWCTYIWMKLLLIENCSCSFNFITCYINLTGDSVTIQTKSLNSASRVVHVNWKSYDGIKLSKWYGRRFVCCSFWLLTHKPKQTRVPFEWKKNTKHNEAKQQSEREKRV